MSEAAESDWSEMPVCKISTDLCELKWEEEAMKAEEEKEKECKADERRIG